MTRSMLWMCGSFLAISIVCFVTGAYLFTYFKPLGTISPSQSETPYSTLGIVMVLGGMLGLCGVVVAYHANRYEEKYGEVKNAD